MRILIATSQFKDLAGSEITVLEYAQEFKYMGHDVTIASFEEADTYSVICKEKDISVGIIQDESLSQSKWDIIWVFHSFTYYALFSLNAFKAQHVIFSSLSHYEPLESPPIETRHIDLFTTNSVENLNFFKSAYPDYEDRARVLPNSIPRDFLQDSPTLLADEKKLIVVSNHVPEEVNAFAELLKNTGWHVDIYGIEHKHQLITATDLKKYSACISIGKTVQYCLGLKIPVFCYDRFGGPGWITSKNIDRAEEFNFSGRCSNSKLSANEILGQFSFESIPTIEECDELAIIAEARFSLESNLSAIITNLHASSIENYSNSKTNENILVKNLEIYLREKKRGDEYLVAWKAETSKRESVEEKLLSTHDELQHTLNLLSDTSLYKENTLLQEKLDMIEHMNSSLIKANAELSLQNEVHAATLQQQQEIRLNSVFNKVLRKTKQIITKDKK